MALAWTTTRVGSGFAETCQVFFVYYINHRVEMISQKAKRVRLRDLKSVFPPQFHEVSVIPLLNENILTVVPAIEDVIEISKRKRDWVG